MNEIELNQKTRDLLDCVRHRRKCLSVYEMPPDLAEAAVWEIGKILLDHQALPLVQYNTYRWYLRELAKLLRTKTEWNLALELEICLRKWVAYSLNPELLQALLCECYFRIGAMTPVTGRPGSNSTTKTRRHKEVTPKKRASADDADSADCVSASGADNDGRCTLNEATTAGAGNG